MVQKKSVSIGELKKLVPTQDVVRCVSDILDATRDAAKARVELEKVKATREVALASIRSRHELYKLVIEKLFDERREAIQKHFDIIDKGIRENKDEVVLAGLRGVANIVSASPFADLVKLRKVLDGDDRIEV